MTSRRRMDVVSAPVEPFAHALAAARTTARRPAPAGLGFVGGADLKASQPAEPNWIWDGYAAPGSLVMFAGKPKVGKSTLVAAAAEAVVTGAPSFLGRAIAGGPVVLVSEESAGTLVAKLPAHNDLRVLTRDAAWPRPPWPEVVAGSVAEAQRVGAALLVVDTFAFWGQLPAEREKDAGAVQAAMDPLVEATRAGLAVILVHHHRKAGGDDGDAIRGSSGLAGAADVLVELDRSPGNPHHRRIATIGRWPQSPPLSTVERDPATGAWRVISTGEERPAEQRDEAADQALHALRTTGPLPLADLARQLGRSPKDGTVRRALQRLQRDGRAHHTDAGWTVPPDPTAPPATRTTQTPLPAQHSGVPPEALAPLTPPTPAKGAKGRVPPVGGLPDGTPVATCTSSPAPSRRPRPVPRLQEGAGGGVTPRPSPAPRGPRCCRLCGASLEGRPAKAIWCTATCRVEAWRLARILDGSEPLGYRSVAARLAGGRAGAIARLLDAAGVGPRGGEG